MNEKNTKQLYSDFSELFQDEFLHERGFECGDGWFELIYDLSKQLNDLNIPELRVTQVKQKMGFLVYRVNNLTDEVNHHITETENKAKETCEKCSSDHSEMYVCKRNYIVLCKYCASLGDNTYDCVTYEKYAKNMEEG